MQYQTLAELKKTASSRGVRTGGLRKADIIEELLYDGGYQYIKDTAKLHGISVTTKDETAKKLVKLLSKRAPAGEGAAGVSQAASRRHFELGATESGIPKIIHQIWIGGDIPVFQALYMNGWKTMAGWKYMLWTNDYLNEKNFPRTWPYIQRAIQIGKEEGKHKMAQIADLMRLEAVQRFGGVYADATLEPLRNLDGLFEGHPEYKFVVSNEDPCGFNCRGADGKKYVSNSFFASVPDHPFLQRILSKNVLDKINFSSKHVNMETGPYFIRRNMKKSDGITMLPTDLIYPHGYAGAYSEDRPDKCFSYEPFQSGNIVIKGAGGERFIQYPCREYPKSFTIKHWEIGGSWK